MNTIYEGKKWICTVEVENKQSDYARCLQLILWLEKIAATGKTSGGEQPLEFYISRLLQASVNNANVLLQLEEYLANGEDKKIKKIVSENQLLAGLAKSEKSSLFHYYLRVKMNENTDISELQYMVLVLQTLPEIRDRIAIRLMGDIDYDWETRDYFRVSHFLRFVQEKHKCFYACYGREASSLQALSHRAQYVQTTFFPLLEVDSELCQEINRTWFLEANYEGDQL